MRMSDTKELKKTIRASIPRNRLAPPGIPGELVIVAKSHRESASDQSKLKDTSLRDFEVSALFTRGITLTESLDFTDNPQGGSSYLTSPKGLGKFEFADGSHFEFSNNANNEISKLTFRTKCKSKNEAFDKFYKFAGPFIDYLSYLANVPIGIQKTVCFDKKNLVTLSKYATPYHLMQIHAGNAGLPMSMLPILSLYREAKNSISPFYRLFCYLKILEGIFKRVRPETSIKAKKHHVQIKREKEVLPNDSELIKFDQGKHVGRPIQKLFEEFLQQEFRNALAHFSLDDSTPWNLTDHTTQSKVLNHLLIAELCCRTAIKNELNALEQLAQAGVQV